MTTPSTSRPTDGTDSRGPLRRRADTFLTAAFKLLLVAMLVLGAAEVLVQAVGLVLLNPGLVEGAAAVVEPVLFATATVFGTLTLLLAYVRGWKSND